MRIGEILKSKQSTGVVTISPEASVKELIATLAQHNIGALIVSGDGTGLDGIVSERDVVRRLHADGTVINNTVGAIMTTAVKSCGVEDTLDDVMGAMSTHRIRHIPVVEEGNVIGIVSIGDLVKHKIDQLQFERDQLDQYVHQS
jgi:CBS domain-containing protein